MHVTALFLVQFWSVQKLKRGQYEKWTDRLEDKGLNLDASRVTWQKISFIFQLHSIMGAARVLFSLQNLRRVGCFDTSSYSLSFLEEDHQFSEITKLPHSYLGIWKCRGRENRLLTGDSELQRLLCCLDLALTSKSYIWGASVNCALQWMLGDLSLWLWNKIKQG